MAASVYVRNTRALARVYGGECALGAENFESVATLFYKHTSKNFRCVQYLLFWCFGKAI